jgi:hypothetical protein
MSPPTVPSDPRDPDAPADPHRHDGARQDTGPTSLLTRLDTTKPHSARVWNCWLGGKDNFAADRQLGGQVRKVYPQIAEVATASRGFLRRAIRFLGVLAPRAVSYRSCRPPTHRRLSHRGSTPMPWSRSSPAGSLRSASPSSA